MVPDGVPGLGLSGPAGVKGELQNMLKTAGHQSRSHACFGTLQAQWQGSGQEPVEPPDLRVKKPCFREGVLRLSAVKF